jgi:hypothetical protein
LLQIEMRGLRCDLHRPLHPPQADTAGTMHTLLLRVRIPSNPAHSSQLSHFDR